MSHVARKQLLAELASLELEEHEVSARRRKLHERLAIFPSERQRQTERELSARRRDVHRRIATARAELSKVGAGASADVAATDARLS